LDFYTTGTGKMLCNSAASAGRAARRSILQIAKTTSSSRNLATVVTVPLVNHAGHDHKVVVVGAGSAGLAISHQLVRTGKFSPHDIAVVDPADWHHYQPGWTLVGGGLKNKEDLREGLPGLIDPKLKFYNSKVAAFSPEQNSISLDNGDQLNYEHLVVVPGIKVDFTSIKGLPEALNDPKSLVSSIYSYDYCDKVFPSIKKLTSGSALFTQPAGIVKCAGAPQKAMWLALDHWKRAGLYNPSNPSHSKIDVTFATGLPVMFGVPKYAAKLEELRVERAVEGLFEHDLVSVDGNVATFSVPGNKTVKKRFDFLHAVPKMGPHAFVRNSPLANAAGFVDVDDATTRHKKYDNVWSVGDASSLPTSKTIAAITSQAPVLVENLMLCLEDKTPSAAYDGYTSCPLVTEYGKVLLAEFKYGGEPKETFKSWFGIDQATPRRAFYHLKKDFFPWVYSKSMIKGTWGGPRGWIR